MSRDRNPAISIGEWFVVEWTKPQKHGRKYFGRWGTPLWFQANRLYVKIGKW